MRRRELLALAVGLGTGESVFAVSTDGEVDAGRGSSRTAVTACVSACGPFEECGSRWCDGNESWWCPEENSCWCDGKIEWDGDDELPDSLRCDSIERLEAECATGQTGVATVRSKDGRIRLRGVIEAPTPCYDIALEAVDVDGDDVVIAVAVTDPLDGFCVQCVGAIRYEVRLAFEVPPPDSVAVVHHTMGETRRIDPQSTADHR